MLLGIFLCLSFSSTQHLMWILLCQILDHPCSRGIRRLWVHLWHCCFHWPTDSGGFLWPIAYTRTSTTFSISDLQGRIFPTFGPWTNHKLGIKKHYQIGYFQDTLKYVTIKVKSFKLWLSFIWPPPLRLGDVDEWFMHKILIDTTHTHKYSQAPIYIYIYMVNS